MAQKRFSGDLTGGATPVPIPNTAVKLRRADDTARHMGGKVGRRDVRSKAPAPTRGLSRVRGKTAVQNEKVKPRVKEAATKPEKLAWAGLVYPAWVRSTLRTWLGKLVTWNRPSAATPRASG